MQPQERMTATSAMKPTGTSRTVKSANPTSGTAIGTGKVLENVGKLREFLGQNAQNSLEMSRRTMYFRMLAVTNLQRDVQSQEILRIVGRKHNNKNKRSTRKKLNASVDNDIAKVWRSMQRKER